jgi:DNA-binding LacI/PurR family transcriptional regulator
MATLSDVAARAGVSVSLASRVLNNAPDARASVETRERIRAAAEALGYRANSAARALKGSRTHVLAVVLPDLANSVYIDLLDAAEEEAARHGYLTLLARAEALLRDPEAIPRLVLEGRVDGVIVQTSDAMHPDALAALTSGSTPVIFVNSTHPHGAGSVSLDDEAGASVAAQHLLDLGHREIAFIGGLPSSMSAGRREAGFRETLSRAGVQLPETRITRRGYTAEQGATAIGDLLHAHDAPTAVVVANVNAAYGVLAELRRRRVSVPAEMSVIAIHESLTAENTWPPLTTVHMPLGAAGTAAVQALLARIESGEVRDIVVRAPAPHVRQRASTAAPGVERTTSANV